MTATDELTASGAVAFVTGAGSGIGRATALAFASRGVKVALADVSEEDNHATLRLVEEAGGHAVATTCDVTRTQDITSALDATVEAFGRLDHAVNNAGVDQTGVRTAECTEEEWDRVLATDLRGVFVPMTHEIPLMIQNGEGAIVNISSAAGVRGFPGQPAHVAAKHGVVGPTEAAALDHVGQNIRINAVCPGITDTPMMAGITGGTPEGRQPMVDQKPIGRMGRPEEIAAAVMWSCSDAASFAIGRVMVVDGGQTVCPDHDHPCTGGSSDVTGTPEPTASSHPMTDPTLPTPHRGPGGRTGLDPIERGHPCTSALTGPGP